MEDIEFSPEQRGRADAFVKAFSKKPLKEPVNKPVNVPPSGMTPPLKESGVKPPSPFSKDPMKEPIKDPLPKPAHRSSIIDPTVLDEPVVPSSSKIAIGAEYNARKIQENKERLFDEPKPLHQGRKLSHFLIAVCALIAFVLSLYNYQVLSLIQGDQQRIINNQKVLFDKLARLGQKKR